jgi:hypothetical protein
VQKISGWAEISVRWTVRVSRRTKNHCKSTDSFVAGDQNVNRPIRPLTENQNAGAAANQNDRRFFSNRRRGLCTAEEIVTLILKRYGLDEEAALEKNRAGAEETHVGIPVMAAALAEQQTFCWD